MRTRGKLLGAFLGALSLAAALTVAPSPALADEAQIKVSVPTTVPCVVKHDGTVIAPSSWEMKNVGSEEVSLGAVSVTPHNEDEAISLSANLSVAGGAESQWFSYEKGSLKQAKTVDALDPGAIVSVHWSVGKLDAEANASTLEEATKGEFKLARVDFHYGQKQAFAVWYSDGTAGLYNRLEVPDVGDTFDGHKVTRVVTGIEDKSNLFENSKVTSVKAVDEGIKPTDTSNWFNGCSSLATADLAKLNTSRTTNMRSMFGNCEKLASPETSPAGTSRA